jgi:hypothetical protein
MNGTPLVCSWCFKPASRYVRRLGAKAPWDLSCSDQHAENLPIQSTGITPDGKPMAEVQEAAAATPTSPAPAPAPEPTPEPTPAPEPAPVAKPAPLTSPLASLFSSTKPDQPATAVEQPVPAKTDEAP